MKINWNEKYTTISVYTVLTFGACIIVYALLFNFTAIGGVISKILRACSPLLWGVGIAFVLNSLLKKTERFMSRFIEKKNPHPKINRVVSVAITMILFVALLVALISIIVPRVMDSLLGIIENLGTYFNNLEKWFNGVLAKHPELLKSVNSQIETLEKTVMDLINNEFMPKITDILKNITEGAFSFLLGLKDFLIGLIVSVYLLIDKEHFQAQLKKILCALFPERASESILKVSNQVNASISNFISGKIIDSLIIGCLCFICMTIMKLDFILLISVIVGVTNIIPFFGPFIGAIPSAVLLLVSDPKEVIPFLIMIFIVQQLDGNVIGPKILGQSIGISAFWVLFAILVGGGLFGFAGMVLGVPIFAVLYSLISEYITYLLENKNLPTATAYYRPPAEAPQPLPEKPKPEKKRHKNKRR